MNFVVKEMHPLSIIEEACFRDLCATINPHARITSADTGRRKIDVGFRSLQGEIKNILQKVEYVCVTADAWTCMGMSRSLGGSQCTELK